MRASAALKIDTSILQGGRLRMTAATPQDLSIVREWFDDSNFSRHFDSSPARPLTVDQVRDNWAEFSNTNQNFQFVFRPLIGDDLIVLIALDGIQWTHRTSFLSIAVHPRYQGQRYGYEAMQIVLKYAFREFNLHAVRLTVFSYNLPAIALYEKLGFQREGIYREHLLRDGQRYDMLLYGLLRREWEAKA